MPYTDDEIKQYAARVNKVFYDAVFKDPWLSRVFANVTQQHIEAQQTDFMVAALGGPKRFMGRNPSDAHAHIYITEEMWRLREKHLLAAFAATRFPDDLAKRWISIDEAFKGSIVKASPAECVKRFASDEIINHPNPAGPGS